MVYRFRITFEEHEDVSREIEILGKQTYENFHRAIQEAIGFDNAKDASFFMSDDLWRKGQEIALTPPPQDDDDDDYPRRGKKEIRQMSKSRIADFIDDPHQRLLYVYDPQVRWTLMIELVKIVEDDPKASYPRCTRSSGAAPRQYKVVLVPPADEEEEEDDEEDKKRKEKAALFAVEAFDASEQPEGEEGEDDVEGGGEEGGEEGEAEADFDPEQGGEEEF